MSNLVLVALSFAAVGLANAALVPSLTECQPVLITWSDGAGALITLTVHDSNGAVLKDFGQVEDTSLTWVVDVPADTAVSLEVVDSVGELAQTALVEISEGDDTSCIA
ncbi:hypothetical protein BDZ89DRAFT_1056398 [Hymenopellis radicata]|nr:hypothetical protein BDZ89DRAFT_1056398 [Hymenopellis radicata]